MTTFNTSEKLYINIISIKKLSLVKNQLYHKINGERENMDAITLAIVTGLAIPLTKDALADAYAALKAALKKKFGDESDVVNAVEQLEKKPDSEGRKATLQEEVENAKNLIPGNQYFIELVYENGHTIMLATQKK